MATVQMPSESSATTDLVQRLLAIRERLFWLHAVWSTTLSPNVAMEADRYRKLFRELADELRQKDSAALEPIIAGYEALVFAEPIKKPIIPLAAQQWHELAGELRSQLSQPAPPPKPPGYLPDGLQRFV